MKHEIINYLDKNIRQSIINDVQNVACFHAANDANNRVSAGFHSIPREVFCYVDFLGCIAYGKNGTKNAVDFIKRYFPQAYRDYAELIYSMWRHGTVHEYDPKVYFAKCLGHKPKKLTIRWQSNNDNLPGNRKANLKVFSKRGKRATIYFNVNIHQLVDDLLSALDNFLQKLKNDMSLKKQCQKYLNNISKPQGCNSIQSNQQSQIICSQILLAWKNKSTGMIDSPGRTQKKT